MIGCQLLFAPAAVGISVVTTLFAVLVGTPSRARRFQRRELSALSPIA